MMSDLRFLLKVWINAARKSGVVFMAGILAVGCAFGFGGCASMTEIDRARMNLPQADLSKSNRLGEPAPQTGLRKLSGAANSGACSACAH